MTKSRAAGRNPRDYFYGDVMRLPPGTRNPDHYTLLGLRFFEDDHDTILRGSLERIRLLETCQVDPRPGYRKMAERLLVEVRDAQLTLLDSKKRSDYDAALIGRQELARKEQGIDEDVQLPVGSMFHDRYRILREVRVGGLGSVYEAMDRNLRAKVHISVLRPSLSRDRSLRRPIENEARKGVTTQHANLLRLDEIGDAGGVFFVRSRAHESKSLRQVLELQESGRLDADEVWRIGREVLAALRPIHDIGGAHGRLRLDNVLIGGDGSVLVSDAFIARAVADAIAQQPGPEATPAGDIAALGVLLYRLLTGKQFRRDDGAAAYPEETPSRLIEAMGALLAPDARRPTDAKAAAGWFVETPELPDGKEIPWKWVAIAASVVALILMPFAFRSGGDNANGGDESSALEARSWRSLAEGRYEAVIASLQGQHDRALVVALARAYESAARDDEARGNVWRAQQRLAHAQKLEPNSRRERAYARVAAIAQSKLDALVLPDDKPRQEAVFSLDVRAAHLAIVRLGGEELDLTSGVASKRLSLGEGEHRLACELVDVAGNKRTETVVFAVDRTPPSIVIESPEDGARLTKQTIPVVLRVKEKHPREHLRVQAVPVAWTGAAIKTSVTFKDGNHSVVVEATDAAGNIATATARVIVDTLGPKIQLTTRRVVTKSGRAEIVGRVTGRVSALRIDGRNVSYDADGSFTHALDVMRDRTIKVEAQSASGLTDAADVVILFDQIAPQIAANPRRTDKDGLVLYGSREIAAKEVAVGLRVKDKTELRFETKHGRIANGSWFVPTRGGRHRAKLTVIDEAGWRSSLEIELEGRAGRPKLQVKCALDEGFVSDRDVVLDIDSDGPVLVQGQQRRAGRIRLPLKEGSVSVSVVRRDRYGNEAEWKREFHVDRTPPELKLLGGSEFGMVNQKIRFRANEPLREVRCVGKVFSANSNDVEVDAELGPGKRTISVLARDRAGNQSRTKFNIEVVNHVLRLGGKGAVKIPFPAKLSMSKFTIECWVRGTAPVRTMVILSNYFDGGAALVWSHNASGPYAVWLDPVHGRQTIEHARPWRWDEWTHLALCGDGRKVRFFVDGSLQGSFVSRTPWKPSSKGFLVGGDPDARRVARNHFAGEVDEVRISSSARYTRAFTPQRHFKTDDKTHVLLRFDSGDKRQLRDASGNGRHGEVVGEVQTVRSP